MLQSVKHPPVVHPKYRYKVLDNYKSVDITMYNLRYEVRTREGLVEKVYDCIRNNTPLSSIHIPHSDVFFVREALEARFDCELSLFQVEEYMREAGWCDTGES